MKEIFESAFTAFTLPPLMLMKGALTEHVSGSLVIKFSTDLTMSVQAMTSGVGIDEAVDTILSEVTIIDSSLTIFEFL